MPAASERRGGRPPIDPAVMVVAASILSALWGMLAIYSVEAAGSAAPGFLNRQMIWLGVGAALGAAAWRIDFSFYHRHWRKLALAGWLALAGLPFFGIRVNGMAGWYDCGFFHLQPSELAKPFFLLALIEICRLPGKPARNFLLAGALTAAFAGLIALQPDFGTLALYAAALVIAGFLAGCGWRLPALAGLLTATTVAIAVHFHPYVLRRFLAYWDWRGDPAGSGWHWFSTQLAIARGGWEGCGLGEAWWSDAYLPLAVNDSIFAAIAETLGVAGAWAVLALWGLLLWGIFRLGRAAPTPERQLFIHAAGAWLGIQALAHLSVNTGLLPMTGLALPFYSYGGSSLAATFLLIGIALSAARPEKFQEN